MMTSIMQDKKNIHSRSSRITIRILAVAFWLLVWQIGSMWLGQEILLASPVSVARKLSELLVTQEFWIYVWFSFGRIIGGFLSALAIGALLAILSYRFETVKILFHPLVTAVKSTPVASFIILCLIWIPSRNLAVFISFLIVFPVIYANLLEGLQRTDEQLLEMADVFSIGKGKRALYIYLPQALPYLMTACSLGLGLCWKAGTAAEVIGVPEGSIGEKLYHAKIYLNTPDLFAWTLVIITISFLFEKCFLWGLGRIIQWIERT